MLLKIFPLPFLGLMTLGISKPLSTNYTAFDTVYQWKFMDYEYDSASRQKEIMKNGLYDKQENAPDDFDLAEDGRMFVTVFKLKGVLSSLNIVSDKNGTGGPLLKPYPDWNWHARNDCIGIRNAYRIQIDQCNRLWVLDTGLDRALGWDCPAQLMMFDLSSDKLQLRIAIPNEFFKDRNGRGVLYNLLVQSDGYWCENTTVLMSYSRGSGLVVWNGKNLWRLNGPYPENLKYIIYINRLGIITGPGTFGWSLSPKIDDKPQTLLLRPRGTKSVFSVKLDDILATSSNVPTLQLKDFSDIYHVFDAIKAKPVEIYDDKVVNYTTYDNVLPSSAAAFVFNPDGILFIGLNELTAIACWNSTTKLTAKNIDIVDKDKEALEWTQEARVLQSSRTGNDEEELWIMTNKFAKFTHNKLKWSEINFRIMKKTTSSLLTNSKCMA